LFAAAAPTGRPHIRGLQGLYLEGDTVEANCTSSPSKPVTSITWYMNDKQVGCRKDNKLTAWNRVLGMPIVTQQVKKFPTFYGT